MATNLKPFRQHSEYEVINGLFTWKGTVPATAGTFVQVASGWVAENQTVTQASVGVAYSNTMSPRWILPGTVTACTDSGQAAIGMLLYDVRELDENGEKLIFHPRKAEENNWVISGEGLAIATRGLFIWSGLPLPLTPAVSGGATAYLGNDGGISVSGTYANGGNVTKVGKFLGPVDSKGWVLFKLEL